MSIVNDRLRELVIKHEGYSEHPYMCTAGRVTIGYGRNLDDIGVSRDEATYMLENDLKRCERELQNYSWYLIQPKEVQFALIDMCFNMGINRLLKFTKMIEALSRKDYAQAAIEALNSIWAKQVGKRACDIAVMIRERN